jgi:tol-pal system protein YbgF
MSLKDMVHKGGILFFCPNKDLVRVSHVHLNYSHMGLKSSIPPAIYSLFPLIALLGSGACSHTPKSGLASGESDAARDQILKLQEKVHDLEIRLGALNDKINLENSAKGDPRESLMEATPTSSPIITAPLGKSPVMTAATSGTLKISPMPEQAITPAAALGKNIPPPFASDEAIDRFREAKILFDSKRFSDAILEFASFLKNHPDHSLAASAQYHLGMSYVSQKEFKIAEEELSRGMISYPHSSHIPDTLLALSKVSDSLNKEARATYYREKLKSQFPHSPQAKEVLSAKALLDPVTEPMVISEPKSAGSGEQAPHSPPEEGQR